MMRFALTFLAVAAALGLFTFFNYSERFLSGPSEPMAPLQHIGEGPDQATLADTDELPDSPPILEPESGPTLQATDREEVAGFGNQELVDFHGTAWLQPKGEGAYLAVRGTIEIAILNNGRLVPMSVAVNQGRFSVEVPDRCRVRVQGGQLEDQTVRYLKTEGPFTLDAAMDYAMIGEPIPVNRLLIFEGTQRVPLAGVTVRTSVDGVTALMEGAAPVGEVLVADAASPIDLPYLSAQHPVWLHVSAEGYATTALLLDPQKANEKEVVLWPAATLTVRVTGPARSRLKALVVHRHEPAANGKKASKRHFATFNMSSPGITTDTDATIFTMQNLPALALTVEARGFDKRGRETLLGSTSVELGVNEAGLVNLRLEGQ